MTASAILARCLRVEFQPCAFLLSMGLAGFLAGFLGPLVVAPEANQGPLLGIFITGPLGVVAGAVIGIILPRLAPERLRGHVLNILTATTFVGILLGLVFLR